ncbi:alpha/beta fold hydrolase [Roseateles asaccharophilus]|uniref:Poly(3-hydroxyalkanoate) synthetase n=1 Tax=Roseateles asaccharophilus TaxID=582607 RepID=A0ABU2A242_9BURK|nr:alpha/beta fold hydrolase [Roseateles asaccharophilus]MDR7331264.1 poly(3-hydroxyalkanoate) synthetase [Roseateles asaccharophilus]
MSRNPPACEHTVPFFWPWAAAMSLGGQALQLMKRNANFMVEADHIDHPPQPEWATPNTVRLDLKTMRLRDFGATGSGTPVLVDAPYAGHSSTIADYAPGQSLVQTLRAHGLPHVLATDWKTATPRMRWFDIDTYLSDLNVAVDDLGGQVHLVGLCQGGWLSTTFAARFPGKVKSLVLAGSPIDTNAGHGPIRKLAHEMPLPEYEAMVDAGHGLMPGAFMLAGWKNTHPAEQFYGKYVDLYEHITDRNYLERTETFERWYENPVDLPGARYVQAIDQLFKRNLLAGGGFVALGRAGSSIRA